MADVAFNATERQPSDGMVVLTHLIYGMHAFSALNGLLSPAFIVTAFLAGWPSIIAVILNYLKRGKTRSTFLESHFRWQIRTFWFALLWVVLAYLTALTIIGIPLAVIIALAAGVWVMYRIVRGWMRLANSVPMPL